MEFCTTIEFWIGAIGLLLAVLGLAMALKASAELRAETDKLRTLHELTLKKLFDPNVNLTPRLDENGRIVGAYSVGVGHAGGTGSASARSETP